VVLSATMMVVPLIIFFCISVSDDAGGSDNSASDYDEVDGGSGGSTGTGLVCMKVLSPWAIHTGSLGLSGLTRPSSSMFQNANLKQSGEQSLTVIR
jgi:hypothetical protein